MYDVTEAAAPFNVEEATGLPITTVNPDPNIRICDMIVRTAHTVSTDVLLVLLVYATNGRVQLTLNPRFLKTDALGKSVLNTVNAFRVKLG
jgi:hypothetical protein